MIETNDLTKVFKSKKKKEIRAVDGASFTCQAGEVFGLLGPNGAGKTSLMRMLSTVLLPSSGSAKIAGYDVRFQAAEVRQRIGFLSGDTGLYPRLTAREMIRYFGKLYGLAPDLLEHRIETVLELLDMTEFADRRNGKLSSGMKQKVSIARTIVHDPPVLILDEPTVGLDILSSRTIVEFIHRCRDDGKCLLFSTHIMGEAQRLCDRIAILHRGRIMAVGTLEELRQRTGKQDLEDVFIQLIGDLS